MQNRNALNKFFFRPRCACEGPPPSVDRIHTSTVRAVHKAGLLSAIYRRSYTLHHLATTFFLNSCSPYRLHS